LPTYASSVFFVPTGTPVEPDASTVTVIEYNGGRLPTCLA
jgi:hypothetical protein